MAVTKKIWQEPQVRSIDDLSTALGASCNQGTSATSGASGNCSNGNSARPNKCTTGGSAGDGRGASDCATGTSVI